MRSSVARKLYRSILDGDPQEYGWFEEATTVAMNEGVPLDQVIWDAVREIVEDLRRGKGEAGQP